MSAPIPPDPYRIKRILNKLEKAWETMPDKDFTSVLIWTDIDFLVEGAQADDCVEKYLDTYLKDHSLSGWKS